MIDLLRTRRSIRKFTNQPVEPEKVEILKEAVIRAPTSRNSQAGQFIFVDEPELIQKLAQCKSYGATPLLTATLAVVVLSEESKTAAWVEDSAIAAFAAHLAAHSLGLGSCWIQIRGRHYSDEKNSETYVRETLAIPDEFRVLSIVAIGYATHPHEGRTREELKFEKIRTNGF